MFGGILLFDDEFIHVVSITFTSLILTELLMVALTIRTWHWMMFAAEIFSLAVYIASLVLLKDYFGECAEYKVPRAWLYDNFTECILTTCMG